MKHDDTSIILLEGEHFVLEFRENEKLVVLRRTAEPFESIETSLAAYIAVRRKLDTLARRSLSFLVDLRNGPPRNDPEFEAAIAAHRRAFFDRFSKTAVLVRTAAGRMQLTRHMRDDGLDSLVTTDKLEALRYLAH